MKLVDILARELKVWPVKEGECNKESDYCAQSDTTSQVFFCGRHGEIFLSERADETSEVRVTRSEWQAAVDALKVEQETRTCTHPKGCTQCSWCGFKDEKAAEIKWPYGAEFMGTTDKSVPTVFYRNISGGFYEYAYEHENWKTQAGHPARLPLIPRPTEWAIEWDEYSFPPAGTTCEFTTNDGHNWKGCKILYADDLSILTGELEGNADRRLLRKCDADVKFRPIRTAEQVAAEEWDKARTEALNAMTANGKTANESEALWKFRLKVVGEMLDMGYRKQ